LLHVFVGAAAVAAMAAAVGARVQNLATPSEPAVPEVTIDPSIVRLPLIDANDLRFTHISGNSGLSQTRVTHIVQDNQGFMWFGTQYGLNRYDGYKFKVFKHEENDPNSLSGAYISSLFKDRLGTLWVGCVNTLDKFNAATDTFSHYRIDTQDPSGLTVTITHISQDHAGNLWLASVNGLYRLDPVTGQITRFSHDPANPRSLSSNEVKFSGEDRSRTLWVATSEGLDSLDPTTGIVNLHVPLHESRDVSFFEDRFGVFWITYASGNGLAVLDRVAKRLTRYAFAAGDLGGAPLTGVIGMIEDRGGTLWLGTFSNGMLKFDREHRQFIRYRNHPGDPQSISEDRVTTVYEDNEGNIWEGLGATEPNFFSETPAMFSTLPNESAFSSNLGESLVNSIFEDREGYLWIGTTGGLSRLDRKTGAYKRFSIPGGGIDSDVLAINQDASGSLWLGTSGQGLYRFDPTTGRILKGYRHRSDDPSSLSNDIVDRILIDHAGALWASTDDGLDRLDPATQRFTTYRREPGKSSYLAVAEDSSGVLWLGGRTSGLVRFDPQTHLFSVYRHEANVPGTLSDNRLNAVFVESSGIVWAGTQNGLNRVDPRTGEIRAYYERNGLPSNAISCILGDSHGNLWISTNQGVSRFNPQTGTFNNYSVADGLPGSDLTGWGACSKSSSGEMFFGGFAGATAVQPDRAREDIYSPPIVLTDFELSGTSVRPGTGSVLSRSIDFTDQLTLAHNQDLFSLEFSALSFRSPVTNRYRYMLVGLDHDWHNVRSDRRLASYTTLAPGAYDFRVEGASARGPWSEPGASLHITILPPWWETWWLRTLAGALLVLIILALYYYRVRQIRQQFAMRLVERLEERTRIARDLHDTFFQGIQGLLLRFNTALSMLDKDGPAARGIFRETLETSDRVMLEGRDFMIDLRAGVSQETDLAGALSVVGDDLKKDHAAELRVTVIGDPRPLHPLVFEQLRRLGREALSNAFRHAQAKTIEVDLHYERNQLRLRVRDDGMGIAPDVLSRGSRVGHWGLPGMRERAKALGGQLDIWSRANAGSEIDLRIPAAVAYAPNSKHARYGWLRWVTGKAGRSSVDDV